MKVVVPQVVGAKCEEEKLGMVKLMAPTFERCDQSLPHYADNCSGVCCLSCNTTRWHNYVRKIRAENPI